MRLLERAEAERAAPARSAAEFFATLFLGTGWSTTLEDMAESAELRCPECGEFVTKWVLALTDRREGDSVERVCKVVIGCPNSHGPFWRWIDRGQDQWQVDEAWADEFVEHLWVTIQRAGVAADGSWEVLGADGSRLGTFESLDQAEAFAGEQASRAGAKVTARF